MTSKRADFFLEVVPRPASRPRFTCRGKFAAAYTDAPYKAWQEQAKTELAKHRPFGVDKPHTGDVAVNVTVIVGKPKKTVKVRPSGDTDNYLKGVYDAITQVGGFWEDDDQVVSGYFEKRWATEGETPGYRIEVTFK